MKWEKVFDLPCGCKRIPQHVRKATILVQRWDDLCTEHQARKVPPGQVSEVQKQIAQEQQIHEELRAMALERIQAKVSV
jgi:hypothetical protein